MRTALVGFVVLVILALLVVWNLGRGLWGRFDSEVPDSDGTLAHGAECCRLQI